MDKNVKILLLSLSVGAGLALLVWAIVWHGFEDPPATGWVYNYQALVGALIALAGAGWTVWYLREDIRQSKNLADREHDLARREHALAVRDSYSTLMNRLDLLITRLHRWINNVHLGQQMMAPQARVRDELLMDDPEINRLEVIKTFRQLRNRMALDTTPWQRARQHVHVTDMQEELLALLNDIYRRLDRGEEIEEIARAVDDEA